MQQPRIPIYFGGSSEAAYRVGGKHADVFALWGEPLAETAEQIAAVHDAARAAGRSTMPRISVSFRPILGTTEEQAWERAHDILDRIVAADGGGGSFTGRTAHRQGHEPPARTPAPSGCSPRPSGASCTTARCGPRPRGRLGAAGQLDRARRHAPRPSRRPCWTTSTSASRRS